MKASNVNLIPSLRLIEPLQFLPWVRDMPSLSAKLKLAKTDFSAVNQINKPKILLRIVKRPKIQKKA